MDLRAWLKGQDSRAGQGWPLSLDGVRYAAETIWKTPVFRDYTDHSVEHSDRIIDHLGKLAEGLVLSNRISATEMFVLLAAAYLHDIGMQDERFQDGDPSEVRRCHHELTRRIIERRHLPRSGDNYSLGLDQVPPLIVDAIATVAEGHRGGGLYHTRNDEFAFGSTCVRPRLLAALLRLADELDVDHRRVHVELLSLKDIPPESEFHWLLCHYVSGVDVRDGRITIHYQVPEGCDGYGIVVEQLVRHKIEQELRVLQPILGSYGCAAYMPKGCKVRCVRGLEEMRPEVLDIAQRRIKDLQAQATAPYEAAIKECESIRAALAATQGEVL